MPTITIHPIARHEKEVTERASQNPLPQLLQTPSGLAIAEVQGTFNLPQQQLTEDETSESVSTNDTTIGQLVFPAYNSNDAQDTAWMKQVYLYVGKHQRMTGEVKKLAKPLAVLRKRRGADGENDAGTGDLEVAEIVRYKIIFANRPEPVSVEVTE